MQDIEACIQKANVSEAEIRERALLVVQTYVGPEEDYLYHLNLVLDRFQKRRKLLWLFLVFAVFQVITR